MLATVDCFCGCGTRVSSRSVDANLLASRVALELLAWDKARTRGGLGADAVELESLIARGEGCYRRILLLLHGDGAPDSVKEGEAWLAESFDHRAGRSELTEKGGLFTRPKLRLGEDDYEQLDRAHPGQSFSGSARPETGGVDLAGQLERLGALHAEGVLSDAEFAAAKARVVGGQTAS